MSDLIVKEEKQPERKDSAGIFHIELASMKEESAQRRQSDRTEKLR